MVLDKSTEAKIQLILDFKHYHWQEAKGRRSLDTQFVQQLYHILQRDGSLSASAVRSLDNIIKVCRASMTQHTLHVW